MQQLIQGLVAGLGQQQQQNQNFLDQLMQRVNGAAGGGPQAPVAAEMEAGVVFGGEPHESVNDWLAKIDARSLAKNWQPEAQKRAAQSTLVGRARTWDLAAGQNLDFQAWRAAITANFGRLLTEEQWKQMTEARVQRVGETGITYAMDKLQQLREKPGTALTPGEMVKFIIKGLYDPSQKAVLYLYHQQRQAAQNPPADVLNDFLDRMRQVEGEIRSGGPPILPMIATGPAMYPTASYSSVSPIYTAPSMPPAVSGYSPVVSAPASVDSSVVRTIEQLTRQVAALTQIVTQLPAQTTAPISAPPSTSASSTVVKADAAMGHRRSSFNCYNCQAEGHIARDCSLPPRRAGNQGNDLAGPQGQGRPNQ